MSEHVTEAELAEWERLAEAALEPPGHPHLWRNKQGLCREHYTADLERYRGYAASLRAENAALRARLALADRLAEAIEAPGIVARPMVVRVTYSHWKDIEQAARDYRASAGGADA